ncbi:MAG: protein-glutamate O-methyltransferase CheR [Phycisphaerae bacterium]|nr:protein-glutamate O-methyltransferase CheR [Phycisphaerae bacterium]
MLDIAPKTFQRIVDIARKRWGIHLTERKTALVANRLTSLLRKTGRFASIEDYVEHLERDANEEDMLVFFDSLSTNVTSFFRDPQHFHFLERELWTPVLRGTIPCANRRVRLWSCACSVGCEPYSLAIQALELVPDIANWDVRILATDLSNKALAAARRGVYAESTVAQMDPALREKYFERVRGDDGLTMYRVRDAVRKLVTIRQLNLMDEWPFAGPFDVVFVRNVMIYFDRETRERLVRRLAGYLRPNGVLAVGGAETLSGLDVPLRPAAASVYLK